MKPAFIHKFKLPKKPGVYIFKNKSGDVLYVGKAINLYNRVSSYFHTTNQDEKTYILSTKIAGVKTVVVESELEALILEANLIKKYLPPFNIRLMDDKDFLYIAVTLEDFPKVITVRKKQLEAVKKFWGPFPSAKTVRETLISLRKVFPWCSGITKNGRPCFYYHLGQCLGACTNQISKDDYNRIIKRFSKFLDGKKEELIFDLTKEMTEESLRQNFENAAKIKKMIYGVSYMTQPNRTKLYLENPNFLEDEKALALKQLKKDLNLSKIPARIEGYDISNISGKEASGSLVVLTNGEIDKSQYRRFRIHISGRPNDVGMMREMVKRRLKHNEWRFPDLIIIDGGRGQVKGVNYELQATNYQLPIFGLAKRMEWLYPPEGEIIKLPKRSLSLKLLQKLRDESHRFALAYHRKLRDRILFG